MDQNEYWLLDSVVEARYPVAWLVSQDVEGAFNRRSHGLRRDPLSRLLNELFQRGDLVATRSEASVSPAPFVPTEFELEAAFDRRMDCLYGLTVRGGAKWEAVSQPQWERYLTACVYGDPREGEITGSDRRLVETYESMSEDVFDVSVVPGSKRWDVLEPWPATYWKGLPSGHRLRFGYVERPSATKRDPTVWEALRKIQNWYVPYDLSGTTIRP